MLHVILALSLAVTPKAGRLPQPPPEPPGFKEELAEAIRRHDARDFDGAIGLYRSLLERAPHHALVVYELALSLQSAQVPARERITFIEGELDAGAKPLPQLFAVLATAHDALDHYAEGEAVLRRGLAIAPTDANLNFNLGVNLNLQGRLADALAPLEQATVSDPRWASAWYGLGRVLLSQGKAAKALVALARLVLLEPTSERGVSAARMVVEAVDGLATRQALADGGAHIQIDVPGKNPEDIVAGLILGKRLAGNDKPTRTDRALVAEAWPELIASLRALDDPYFAHATAAFQPPKKRLAEALGWFLLRVGQYPAADRWFSAHRAEEKQVVEYVRRLQTR